jgi:Zn-dependent alcohol dehydrogenase
VFSAGHKEKTGDMKTRAAVLYQTGAASPYAESLPFVIDEVSLEGPGPGELLVEIVSAGLCHSDLSVVDGSRPRPLPMVLGHEASGVVRQAGVGVTDFVAGTCLWALSLLCFRARCFVRARSASQHRRYIAERCSAVHR